MTHCCSLRRQITPSVRLFRLMDFCPSNGCRLLFSAGTHPSTTINIPERIVIWYIGQILIRLTVIFRQAILLRSVASAVAWPKEETGPHSVVFSGHEALAGALCLFRWCKFLWALCQTFKIGFIFVLFNNGCVISSPDRIFHSSSNYGGSSTEQLASDSQIRRKHKGCSRVQKNHRGDGQTARKKILNWLWSRQNQHHSGAGMSFSETVIYLWQTWVTFPEPEINENCESRQLAGYLMKLKCLGDAYSWWQHLHVTYQEMSLGYFFPNVNKELF